MRVIWNEPGTGLAGLPGAGPHFAEVHRAERLQPFHDRIWRAGHDSGKKASSFHSRSKMRLVCRANECCRIDMPLLTPGCRTAFLATQSVAVLTHTRAVSDSRQLSRLLLAGRKYLYNLHFLQAISALVTRTPVMDRMPGYHDFFRKACRVRFSDQSAV